jgi:hypothetical protein
MKRKKATQSVHDKKVKNEARKLSKNGFSVYADIPGYKRPKTIGGYRPDIIAKKGVARKIVEVETQDSKNSPRDLKQKTAFRKAANNSKYTKFRRSIA